MRKDSPLAGIPLGATSLHISSYFKHHGVLRLLISARAKVEAGLHPALSAAAIGNNPEGIRLLYAAGGRLDRRNLFGDAAFEYAASMAALDALEELAMLARLRSEPVDPWALCHGWCFVQSRLRA